jgi:hypothetical protein
MTCSFEDAYQKARGRYSDAQWHDLDLRNQSEAIYQEMRRLDAAAAGSVKRHLPVLANHRGAKIGVRSTGNDAEARPLVNGTRRDEDVIGP